MSEQLNYIKTRLTRRTVKSVLSALTTNTGSSGGGDLTGSGTTNEIAYFTGASSLASLPTSTYPNLTELSYVKGLRATPSRTLLYKNNNVSTTVTGVITNTKIDSYLIPANTIQANDIINFRVKAYKQNTNSSWVLSVRVGTSDTIVGSSQIATNSYGNTTLFSGNFDRNIVVKSSVSSQTIVSTSTALQNDNASSTSALSNLSIDFTQNQYIIVAIQLANASDIGGIDSWFIEIVR